MGFHNSNYPRSLASWLTWKHGYGNSLHLGPPDKQHAISNHNADWIVIIMSHIAFITQTKFEKNRELFGDEFVLCKTIMVDMSCVTPW